MRLAPYALTVGIVLAILVFRAPPTSAQTPQQGGGAIYGWVYGFTSDDELIPLVWVQVTAVNTNYQFTTSTGANGTFLMYVPAGTYNLTVSPPGFVTHSSMVSVSDGSSSAVSFYLEQSHVPVPEFPAQVITMMMVMALGVAVLARRSSKHEH